MSDAACPRCGSFAPLIATEWRALCAPCTLLGIHPIERTTTDAVDLLRTTLQLARETWQVGLALALLVAVPKAALHWTMQTPLWFDMAYTVLVATFTEGVYLSYAVGFALGGVRDFKAAQRRGSERYFAQVGVNAAVEVLVTAGMVLCIPAILFMSWFNAAVPITLFEKRGPLDSLRESFQRTRGHRSRLFVLSLLVVMVTGGPFFVLGTAKGLAEALHYPIPAVMLSLFRALPTLGLAFVNPFLELLQVAVWQATLPVAHAVEIVPPSVSR